jgi:hypothetical protein
LNIKEEADHKVRFDGQRIGKLKVATWNVRGIAENTAKAVLKFGSEAWVLKKREEQHLEAAQMKFFRHLLGIKLHKENNQCIRGKTGAENIVKKIKQYQEKWPQHVQRMDTNRIPKQALQYKPNG